MIHMTTMDIHIIVISILWIFILSIVHMTIRNDYERLVG